MTNKEAKHILINESLGELKKEYAEEKVKDAYMMAIKALEQEPAWAVNEKGEGIAFKNVSVERATRLLEMMDAEPCKDAISRKDAKISLMQFMRNQKSLCECIDDCPSVQPKVKTGHWYDECANDACSVCGEEISDAQTFDGRPFKYCPMCGARMVEPQESEDKE